MSKIAVIIVATMYMCAPAFAATEYYVEHHAASKACRVSEKKPDGKEWKEVGAAHKTMAEAEAAMKKAPECK